ncbi:uncharacterized protein LOC130623495 [Hydractinia symbiolongicarpus]|uniref:uncharacterized protein LOC130623495 n=1 Tax=Hydractinia symbiolongicarpus TaxID=13093 RepID=UPI0025503999|nr:uncharacterized protein LOC130623495 [Hydractinia symbiolongicarpus]
MNIKLTLFALFWIKSMLFCQCEDGIYHMVYQELKPFIFTNDKNETDGMLAKVFTGIKHYCFLNNEVQRNITEFVQYRHRSNSQEELMEILTNKSMSYGTGKLSNISKNKAMWGPLTTFKMNNTALESRGLYRYTFHRSTAIAVIVTREKISLYNKFIRGFLSCKHIVTLAALLIVIFGILIWILERKVNDNFNESFLKGAMTGIWWSFITLTTVGYGDVVPKSPLGRILACVVMHTGMVIICVITGTVTAVVSGTSDLGIYERRVAVMKDSYEERIAKGDYKAETISVGSYEEVVQKVRNGEVFAGLMNEDVAFAYQDNIIADDASAPLRFVYTVPAIIDVSLMVSDLTEFALRYWGCFNALNEEIAHSSVREFQTKLKIETLYNIPIKDLLKKRFFLVLLGLAFGLILMGILLEMFRKVRSSAKITNYGEEVSVARTTPSKS